MKLIAITTEFLFEKEAEAVNLLFEHGLETLHLRKPNISKQETTVFIEQIKKIYHSRIVLHDHYDLTTMFDLKGVHLNRRNWDEDVSQFKKSRLSWSRSCHSIEDVFESQFCDYVFLSPVFDSISKTDYKQSFTKQQLEEAQERKIISEKVIALGGITAENISTAQAYGFGGIAVLGALWSNFETDGNESELFKRFIALKRACNE